MKKEAVGSRHSILLGRERSLLLKKQKGVCPVCEMSLLNDEKVEVHHVLSKKDGGTDKQRTSLITLRLSQTSNNLKGHTTKSHVAI